MKSFSNKYIFIYSTVLVAVVAVILSVVSTSLKPLQERNQRVETKQMLLRTIGVESTTENAEELYATYMVVRFPPTSLPHVLWARKWIPNLSV